MPRVTKVNKAQKDYPEFGIKKGDTYYQWKFRYGGVKKSKTYPKQSQLTQSPFLSSLYDYQDQLSSLRSNCNDPEDLESMVDEIKDGLEELKSDCESSLDNMPEQLQSAPTGELLQERIDMLDSAITDIEGIDLSDWDEPTRDDSDEEWEEQNDSSEMDEDEIEKLKDQHYEEYLENKKTEWLDEKCDELSNISFG